MKRWRLLIFVLVGVLITVACMRKYERQAQRRRDANYQASLQSYTQNFPSGTSRKIVEDYLSTKGIGIQQQSGPADSFNAVSDLVLIGHDPPPWYCSSWPVYIEFDFAARETHNHKPNNSDDSDMLKKIQLESRGEDCL